jgi:hydroxypyruvate isomerase
VPELPRRQFVGLCAAATLTAAAAHWENTFASPMEVQDRFSVMLWTVERNSPFDQRVSKVAEAGYHAIELVKEYKDWAPADFARARQQFQHLNMEVDACSGVDASLCDSSQRDLLLQQIRSQLKFLSELQCSRLILLTGDVVPNLSRDQMHANCVESLKRATDLCAAQNVEILLENIDPEENPKYFLTSVAEGFQIIREVNHPHVRFLYDFFHEQISEGNLIEKLEKNLDLVGLVHVADVPGRHAPGTGEINYANIFRTLGRLNYSHYIAMEFLPTGDVVSELRTAREFAAKYVAEGRKMAAKYSCSADALVS